MAHANVSVFIPHLGCPNNCSFCDQHIISRTQLPPTPDEAEEIIRSAAADIARKGMCQSAEIAFFGGSFTAIPREYMTALLERACLYVENGSFCGIRISTRPDCIDENILDILKKYRVTAIELGAQSMDNDVLAANRRGHTAEDVRRAAGLIKQRGFELGLQMMTGLYKSTPEKDIRTGEELAELLPDTMRIYPVVILRDTYLAQLYGEGEYAPYPFDECVRVCARLAEMFAARGIRVIRLGLHSERNVEENAVGGYYHPAFGELVRSERVRCIIERELESAGYAECAAPKRYMSILVGHRRSNSLYFEGKNVSFAQNDGLESITVNGREYYI